MTYDRRVFSGGGLPIRACPSFFVLRAHVIPSAAQDDQIVGDHPEPDPTLDAVEVSIPTPPEPMTALRDADPTFAPRTPALACGCYAPNHPSAALLRLNDDHRSISLGIEIHGDVG